MRKTLSFFFFAVARKKAKVLSGAAFTIENHVAFMVTRTNNMAA
jgi:hypothetical protein